MSPNSNSYDAFDFVLNSTQLHQLPLDNIAQYVTRTKESLEIKVPHFNELRDAYQQFVEKYSAQSASTTSDIELKSIVMELFIHGIADSLNTLVQRPNFPIRQHIIAEAFLSHHWVKLSKNNGSVDNKIIGVLAPNSKLLSPVVATKIFAGKIKSYTDQMESLLGFFETGYGNYLNLRKTSIDNIPYGNFDKEMIMALPPIGTELSAYHKAVVSLFASSISSRSTSGNSLGLGKRDIPNARINANTNEVARKLLPTAFSLVSKKWNWLLAEDGMAFPFTSNPLLRSEVKNNSEINTETLFFPVSPRLLLIAHEGNLFDKLELDPNDIRNTLFASNGALLSLNLYGFSSPRIYLATRDIHRTYLNLCLEAYYEHNQTLFWNPYLKPFFSKFLYGWSIPPQASKRLLEQPDWKNKYQDTFLPFSEKPYFYGPNYVVGEFKNIFEKPVLFSSK